MKRPAIPIEIECFRVPLWTRIVRALARIWRI
jgi:hypothetical protein